MSKWTVYRLAEQKRKTGSVALRTSQRGRNGFYIRDELLEFERVLLEPMDLSIMLPTTFVTMPQSMVRVKYQSENLFFFLLTLELQDLFI